MKTRALWMSLLVILLETTAFALTPAEWVHLSTKDRYSLMKKLHGLLEKESHFKGIEAHFPGFEKNISHAKVVSQADWAESSPLDSSSNKMTLSPGALNHLGIPPSGTLPGLRVPAGVMHTYGYLFSQTPTPYGLKGKRWVESRVDERLELEAGLFSPIPPRGEFLSNLTRALKDLTQGVTPDITEKGDYLTPENVTVTVKALTWFVPLKEASRLTPPLVTQDTHLLIYGVQFSREPATESSPRWVTAFPIEAGFMASAHKAAQKGFAPRYNWALPSDWKLINNSH